MQYSNILRVRFSYNLGQMPVSPFPSHYDLNLGSHTYHCGTNDIPLLSKELLSSLMNSLVSPISSIY